MYHGNVLMKADTEIIVHTTILPQPSTPGNGPIKNEVFPKWSIAQPYEA